jgi:hypothetical protein
MQKISTFFLAWWNHHKQSTWMALGGIFGALELHSEEVRALIPEHLQGIAVLVLAVGGGIIANLPRVTIPPNPP